MVIKNFSFFVLWLKTTIEKSPPIAPPKRQNIKSVFSFTLKVFDFALILSIKNTNAVTIFIIKRYIKKYKKFIKTPFKKRAKNARFLFF